LVRRRPAAGVERVEVALPAAGVKHPAAVVADPFGNVLVLLDLSKGHYITDTTGNVTGVSR